MPVYDTSQEWLHQSALLLEARPKTTRITTKYAITPPKTPKEPSSSTAAATPASTGKISKRTGPRASIELKTYDPVSGSTLKYRTTKAAEVSRLILALGTLGAQMAGLPDSGPAAAAGSGAKAAGGEEKEKEEEEEEEEAKPAATAEKESEKKKKQKVEDTAAVAGKAEAPVGGGGGAGGGKKKKKKGKK